jgi:hypothetical protein
MRSRRMVTMNAEGAPSRTLKFATDFRAMTCTGFWPVIVAERVDHGVANLRLELLVLKETPDTAVDDDLFDLRQLVAVGQAELLHHLRRDGLLIQSAGAGAFSSCCV